MTASSASTPGEETRVDEALIRDRLANDSGVRVELDQALAEFGYSREELEAELEAEDEPRSRP